MTNHVGAALSRLIRQRSYAGGDLKVLTIRLATAAAAVETARVALRTLKNEHKGVVKRVAELDAEIMSTSAICTDDIYARIATPKRIKCRYGSIVSELVRLLQDAEGPLRTTEIVVHMAKLYGLPVSTPIERRYARKWVTRKLQILVQRGAVKRVHPLIGNPVGLWLWTGL